jgi:aminopeptidase N
LLGYFEDILVLDTFYPMIPASDQQGWYTHYPYTNGDLTYQDASYYLVEVTAPADFVMAASGSAVTSTSDDQVQQIVYAAGPARDFYLAGSKDFTVVSTSVDGILVNSYARAGHLAIQENALTYAAQALETFSNLFGPYPYTEFDVISSPMRALGIEYPGITGIFLSLYEEEEDIYGIPNQVMLESVIVHEVGHQWFYNLVGNDQQNQPWVDESITQYVTFLYFEVSHQDAQAAGLVNDWQSRLSTVDDDQIAIGLPANAYDGVEYSAIVYGRGPLFYQDLASQIGQDTLIAAMRQYVMDYRWQTANTQAIQTELENACGCDLSENFDSWINPEKGF